METVPFVVDTSDGKNLPPDVQTNQQNIKEQKPEIHHLSTLPTRDNFVHCNHNLSSSFNQLFTLDRNARRRKDAFFSSLNIGITVFHDLKRFKTNFFR